MEPLLCPECGACRQFVENHVWLNSGVVVQSGDRTHRMVLMESENLDSLFRGIEEIIGMPIERIVIETKRRATRQYIDALVPDEVKEKVRRREIDFQPLIEANNQLARIMGYGDMQLVDWRYEQDQDDYLTERVKNPYSVPLLCGDMAGAIEAVTGHDSVVHYKIINRDEIEMRSRVVPEHPPEFSGRLEIKVAPVQEGEIELERCGTCGGPRGLSAFKWDLERGTITDTATGRRMAMLGPAYLQAVFDELERELGENIPQAVVEAQHRFVRTGFYKAKEIVSEDQFRDLLALRGMGNLRTLALEGGRLRMRLENAALHLMFVGLMLGYFETMTGKEPRAEWELTPQGVLELEVTAAQ